MDMTVNGTLLKKHYNAIRNKASQFLSLRNNTTFTYSLLLPGVPRVQCVEGLDCAIILSNSY